MVEIAGEADHLCAAKLGDLTERRADLDTAGSALPVYLSQDQNAAVFQLADVEILGTERLPHRDNLVVDPALVLVAPSVDRSLWSAWALSGAPFELGMDVAEELIEVPVVERLPGAA